MKKFKLLSMLLAVSGMVNEINAQEVTLSAGADMVSSYIWRGLYAGPASIQPGLSLTAGNFEAGVWGSTGFNGNWREFDLYAGYSFGNFSLLVTDYFFPRDLPSGEESSYFDFSEHLIEGTLGYSFGETFPLSLAWNTNLAGDDNYSAYMEAGYSVPARAVTLDFVLGITPWKGAYSDGFTLINIAVKGSKEIPISDSYSLPVFTQVVLNPDSKDIFLLFGVSF